MKHARKVAISIAADAAWAGAAVAFYWAHIGLHWWMAQQ